MPLALKPAPETLIWLIVTLAVPEFVRRVTCEELLPVVTFPKARLVGLAVNFELAAVTPLPERDTGFTAEAEFVLNVSEPE
jgi:hypothetical protein